MSQNGHEDAYHSDASDHHDDNSDMQEVDVHDSHAHQQHENTATQLDHANDLDHTSELHHEPEALIDQTQDVHEADQQSEIIDGSTDQQADESINQSINQSTEEYVTGSDQLSDVNTLNQPEHDVETSESASELTLEQSTSQSINESQSPELILSPDQSINQSINQSSSPEVTLSEVFESTIDDESDTSEHDSINQSDDADDQPIEQHSINQSVDEQLTNDQTFNQSVDDQPVDQHQSFDDHSINEQSIDEQLTNEQSTDEQSTNEHQNEQSTDQSVPASASHPSEKPSSQPIDQSVNQSINQSINQPIVEPEDFQMLNQWLVCIAVVSFDLENGPSLEYKFPPDEPSIDCQSINQSICALAFPDSHCHILGDLSFCFRMRIDDTINQSINQSTNQSINQSINQSNDLTQLTSKSDRSSVRFQSNSQSLFGFVCFRQTRDPSNARGFFQKSTVILTVLPCIRLFERVTRMIGNAYHLYGQSIVESAARSISKWPRPQPGRTVRLPLLGTLIDEHLPQYNSLSPTHRPSATPASVINRGSSSVFDFNESTRAHSLPISQTNIAAPSPISLSSLFSSLHSSQGWFQSINLFSTFECHVHNLWFLWELVLTGESVMLMAKTPACSSDAVLGLISLIAPIIFIGDFRPYFTVYDRDFKYYTDLHKNSNDQSINQSMRGLIIGVTNPYFLKCWDRFPNVLTFNQPIAESAITAIQEYEADQKSINQSVNPDDKSKKSAKSPTSTLSPRTIHKLHRTMDAADDTQSINQSILMSKLTPSLLPDESILKKLIFPSIKKAKSPSKESEKKTLSISTTPHLEINNALLRKYFYDLTQSFLSAFNQYVTFEPAIQRKYSQDQQWNPYMKWPELKKLDQKEFLKNVDIQSINQSNFTFPLNANALTRRSKISSLYSRFVSGPHFASWFDDARAAAQAHVNSLIFTRIKQIANEPEAGFNRFKAQARYDNRNAIDMTARCWNYIELAIADEHCIDISLVSVLFLHLSLIRRATPPSQMSELEKIEKDKQSIIQRFANKTQTQSKVNSGK